MYVTDRYTNPLTSTMADHMTCMCFCFDSKAKLLQPSIVFIDNLDRLFNDESLEMSLNCELDSMESKHTVFVLAMATSVRTVKQTFLTPWRFSRKMEISLPDLQVWLHTNGHLFNIIIVR